MPIHLGGLVLHSIEEIRAAFPPETRPSLETLRRHIRVKRLAGRKVGASWYVSEKALESYFGGLPPPTETAKDAAIS